MTAPASPDPPVTANDLQGFKRLRKVAALLEHLHAVGCDRDRAHHRRLHFDDYVLLILLAMFNPLLDSLRMLQIASDLEEVRERLGIKNRVSLGSFSESCRVFEPEMLDEIIAGLWKQLPDRHRPDLFKDLPGRITLVDGTVIRTLRTIGEAMWLKDKAGWRLHLQFDVDRHTPSASVITAPKNTGKTDERSVLKQTLAPGHTYVMDRWYSQFSLYNAIHAIGSNYVCRIRDHSVYEVLAQRPLTRQDKEAGVISDQIVRLGRSDNPTTLPDHPVRLVCVACTPHAKRGKGKNTSGQSGTSGPTSDGTLRIVTDLPEVPAEVIAFLYGYRWTIEVFIRFFKQTLGHRHLLSTKIEGIRIQIAAGIIACMLMSLLTGVRPTKQLQVLMCLYLAGLASVAEVQREVEKERARQARAAAKKS
jgi:hypothetical protein